MISEYVPILVFLAIAVGLAAVMIVASWIVGRHRPDNEKVSQYECGFEPFESARVTFDVRFYLVAILFIIFDLEVAFLFPWSIVLTDLGWPGFISMMVFLVILLWQTHAGRYGSHDHHALQTGAAFWHMVDLLWIVLFPLVYVVR